MPIDLFAALNAMIRAEAARTDEAATRLRPPSKGRPEPVTASASSVSSDSEPDESGTAAR
ncbi:MULTISPECIES: hypothetical protein [unclassified Streptomyces]|uniref:hypothetical protein n=1 Tax=unclassified Streptomyces TaxID=2593676 RepID=UPI00381E9837